MNAKELLNSWLSDNDCKKLAEDINYIDDSSFSFNNVTIESIIYELKNNLITYCLSVETLRENYIYKT